MLEFLLLPFLGTGLLLWTRKRIGEDDQLFILYMSMLEVGVGSNSALWYIYKHEILPTLGKGETVRAIDVFRQARWGRPSDDGVHGAN